MIWKLLNTILFWLFLGCLLFSVSLHYKKEGQEIEYAMFGFAANLNWKGKSLYFISIIIILLGAMSSID